jgi:hypothetical protein
MLSETRSLTLSMPNGESLSLVEVVRALTACFSKTVTALDVVYALKRSGRTLYGFGA